jgi:transcriptional regulator with XRE-family HTH domain
MMDTYKCECGGTLHRQQVPELDFSKYVGGGLRVILENPPAWVCDTCKGVTLDGEVIDTARQAVVLLLIELPERFGPNLAKLMRRLLGLTQQELAERMGLNRVTVADWERGEKELSAQNDLLLRSIAMGVMSEKSDLVLAPMHDRQVHKALARVRKGIDVRELSSLPPFVITEALTALRQTL